MNSRILFKSALILTGHFMLTLGACGFELPTVKPQIINVMPHGTQGFTQGLQYRNDTLFESTGLYGRSGWHLLDASTGNLLSSVPVPTFFGEGLHVTGDNLLLLTWKAGKALKYSTKTQEVTDTLTYLGEGWGLTGDGKSYIMSNGSDTLFFRDNAFRVTKKLPVIYQGRPLRHLNELEWAEGKIYANIWYQSHVAEIAPQTGNVLRLIDCNDLVAIEKPEREAVLNGIAYNPERKHFYLTGKNWKNIFEVKIPES